MKSKKLLHLIYSWNLSYQVSKALEILLTTPDEAGYLDVIKVLTEELAFIDGEDISTLYFYNKKLCVLTAYHPNQYIKQLSIDDINSEFLSEMLFKFYELQNCKDIDKYKESLKVLITILENESRISYLEIINQTDLKIA